MHYGPHYHRQRSYRVLIPGLKCNAMHDQLMSLQWYKWNFVISHDLYEKNDEWYNCVSYFVGYIYYVKYKSSNNHYTVDSNILDRIYLE